MHRPGLDDTRKYFEYIFQARSFRPTFNDQLAEPLKHTALQIRGANRKAAIMVHGIMPRSGTVYVTQLLRLHPDLYAFPYNWFELPFLQLSDHILYLQRRFLASHRHNEGKIGDNDFLALFGAALVAHLHAEVPAGKRLLMKVPSVEYLHYFWQMFPHEQLLVVTRDGRDVVESTLKTWPQIRFSFACCRWRRAAMMVRQFDEQHKDKKEGYWLARFEDAVDNPEGFVREACRRFGLSESTYPFDQMWAETSQVRGSSRVRDGREVVWEVKDKPKDFRPTEYWKMWPWHRKWLFKYLVGNALADLGYCTDTGW